MSTKLIEFSPQTTLCTVGNSKGYIFKQDLLTSAGVTSNDVFRVLVTARKIIFEYPKSRKAGKITPRPLSYYLKKMHPKNQEAVTATEIWPADAPRGKEPLA